MIAFVLLLGLAMPFSEFLSLDGPQDTPPTPLWFTLGAVPLCGVVMALPAINALLLGAQALGVGRRRWLPGVLGLGVVLVCAGLVISATA